MTGRREPRVELRVLRKTDQRARCWTWLGAVARFGHGSFRYDGRTRVLHRLVYEWTFGEIPAGQVVRHTCDNPRCINPAHLVAGTQLDNVRDMVSRGRAQFGAAGRAMTACMRGHPFDATNTAYTASGRRRCRECRNAERRIPGARGPYQTARLRAKAA